ncbi:cytochrome ubiquinol oxidase subunit I [Bacillus sp. V59.32b]|uniref:cytochrome ubiquinol oxidase subunit I n=1 Tax=Bacillus sp. V59.32b TaxID=1758642 RepID=UPI000E3BF376|nr:cytochrome ubiquinol oxidase subunit I [Bacillus sp. V59.32b]RFU68683.1 cytochrome ubiquinol oxidase subunit I [Bacillus sp. V59.32b]
MDHLVIARSMFGTTMGFHIIFATIGVGLPLMMLLAELMYQRTKDFHYAVMAKRWTKTFAVLLGVGIPTGTIAGVQLSLLWPGFMEVIGRVMALPFQIEIYAFFVEALFMSIYVYAADKIPPWMRIISLTLVAFGAVASAVLISNVHAFQGTPAGFRVENGRIVDVEPWKAFFNKSFLVTAGHVALSAYTTGAFVVAAVAAFKMIKAKTGSMLYGFHKKALMLAVITGGVFSLLTALNGHATTQNVFHTQPEKLAAAEGLFETQTHAPLSVLGFTDKEEQEVKWGIEIPWLLSFLAGNSFDTEVQGLNDFPEELWPPLFVHTMFNIMFITGSLLIVLAFAAVLWDKWLKKDFPKWMMWLFVLSGPAAVAAIESGWILACTGRQPWSIYRTLSTANSVTSAPNLGILFMLFIIVYIILGAAVVFVILYYFKRNTVIDDIHRAEEKGVHLYGSN